MQAPCVPVKDGGFSQQALLCNICSCEPTINSHLLLISVIEEEEEEGRRGRRKSKFLYMTLPTRFFFSTKFQYTKYKTDVY